MARLARMKSGSGIYHVVVRGINRQDIFLDEEDYQRYLETVSRMKNPECFEVYGYCLMGNHVHLLIQEKEDEINRIMKRIGTSYALWYNKKYDRVGHVFQDRYKSECVEDDRYLVCVIRYIHQNPEKAFMVKDAGEYKWSSCQAYYGKKEYPAGLTNTVMILGVFSNNEKEARSKFRVYMEEGNCDQCLEQEIKQRKTDKALREEIETLLSGDSVTTLQTMEKPKRDMLLRKIKVMEGVSQRQIARVTGLHTGVVFRA